MFGQRVEVMRANCAALSNGVAASGPSSSPASVSACRSSPNFGATSLENCLYALSPELWVDGNHVDAQHGGQVFDREKEAVTKLESIIKDKKSAIPDATLQGMIDTLVQADRILAEDAIADAIAASGDPTRIAEAQHELTLAATELATGDFDGAVEHYKAAWKRAEEAV